MIGAPSDDTSWELVSKTKNLDDVVSDDTEDEDHCEVLDQYMHAIKDMKDKKRRTAESLAKRINEELYIRNVFI